MVVISSTGTRHICTYLPVAGSLRRASTSKAKADTSSARVPRTRTAGPTKRCLTRWLTRLSGCSDLVVKEPEPPKPLTSEHRTIEPTSPKGVQAIEWAKNYLADRAEPAVQGQGGSGRFFHVACHLMYSALPLDVLRQLIEEVYNPRCQPPWSGPEIEHKLEDADLAFSKPRGLASPDFWDRMRGRTKDTDARIPDQFHEYTFTVGMRSSVDVSKASFGEVIADLFDHVDWAGVLMFDIFKDRVIAINPPMRMDAESKGLTDNDVQLVRAWLEYNGKRLNPQDVRAAIETVARSRAFHPVEDYLTSLAWDEVPRLDRVLPEYFQTAEGPYELAIGPRWFISLVARAIEPGCQSDCTLILEGVQGIGKTNAFRNLMHDPTWYAASTAGVESKDFYENLSGVWLMSFDELDSLSKGSLTRVKTVLTEHVTSTASRTGTTLTTTRERAGSAAAPTPSNTSTIPKGLDDSGRCAC